MKLYLHIGTEKTGSTAIQQHLLANRALLAQNGLLLPNFLDDSNHRALACTFIRDDLDDDFLRATSLIAPRARAKYREKLLTKLKKQLQREHRAEAMVISSEHFHSRLLHQSEVDAFANAIAGLFDSVEIICYLRRQDHMALSFYSQKLRAGFVPPSILPLANVRRLAPELPPFFDFYALLTRWSSAFGEDAVRPAVYAKTELRDGDVISDFYSRLNCAYPGPMREEKANASFSSAAQMALLSFNQQWGNEVEARAKAKPRRDRLSAFLQRRASGAGITPSKEEAQEFVAAFAESNAKVARRWFNRDQLFPETLYGIAEKPVEADWEGAAKLLARFFTQVEEAE